MAYYPSSIISTFTTHQNITEIIDAAHPNLIQAEVVAIESSIGVTPYISGPFSTSRTYDGSGSATPNIGTTVYAGQSTFSNLSDRLTNIENLAATAYANAAGAASNTNLTTVSSKVENLYRIGLLGGF